MNKEKDFLNSAPAPKPPTKEDLQIQKLQLQIEQLKQQPQQKQTKNKKLFKTSTKIIMIILVPFIILGYFLLACAKAVK